MTATTALPLDATTPESALAGLEARSELWADADVVGVGWTARTVRELHAVAHGLVRLLVERLGFRSVVIEGDRQASEALDAFVREGSGDPRAVLAGARPFLATEEMLDVVRWLRERNEDHATDPVRILHGGADDLTSPEALERSLAEPVIDWHGRHGDPIVYLGGVYHTAVAADRVAALVPQPVRSAGALFRDHFGTRYRSVGLTFGSGAVPQDVPPPPPTSLEARLDQLGHATTLVTVDDLRADPAGMAGADRVRIVGPGYDPADDPNQSMTGDPTTWFDVLVHQKVATSATFLT